jgi:hypothetical protein
MENIETHMDAVAGAWALVAAVQVMLADLASATGGLSPLELAEEKRIRQACERLRQSAEEIGTDELVVAGSMGQARPHPLLKVEQELRREISEALRKLEFCATNRAMCDQANALTRRRVPPPASQETGKR